MTKHEKIINYIKELKVGTKISVRQLASKLNVSEGTAYRAIKDAQSDGYVCTMPRIGTIRIEKKEDDIIETLSFAEVVNIVDGSVMGGKNGLHKPLKKFFIGAMKLEDIKRLIEPESLLIVGNRKDAQKIALNSEVAVLITGGFKASDDVIELADSRNIPLISSAYDTFTVATFINQALHNRLAKKDVIRVRDVMVKKPHFMGIDSTVGDWRKLLRKTQHSKFPVVDKNKKVVGIATTNDVADEKDNVPIKNVMSKTPIIAKKDTPAAHVARVMVWEGIEMVPVSENEKLVGVVTRQDAIRALQYYRFQPHIGETIDGMIMNRFSMVKTESGVELKGTTNSSMLNPYAVASCGVIAIIMANAGLEAFRVQEMLHTVLDSFSIYFTKPVQLEQEIVVQADVIDKGRKSGKAEICLFHEKNLVAKSLMSVRVVDR